MSKIFKNTTIYTLGNILPQAAGFFLLPLYTKYLNPSDYGIVSSMQILSALLTVILTLAVDRSVHRLYFDFKTDKGKRDFLGTLTITLSFVSILVLIILFLCKNWVAQLYKSIDFYPFYVYAILTAFFSVFSLIPKTFYQVNEEAGKFVVISLGQFLLSTGLTLWFIVIEGTGAEGMLKGTMLANIGMLPLFIFISYKTINFTVKPLLLRESLSFSLPMVPALISAWVLNLSDRVFIERYLDLHQLGIYSTGYKIAGLILLITGALNSAYGPVFYKLANSEDQKKAREKLYNFNNSYIVVITVVVFLIIYFSKEMVTFFLDPQYLDAYKIIPIIGFGYFASQISGLFNMMIYQQKKTKQLLLISLTGAGFNILFNFMLIPNFGIHGAAYATALSFLLILLSTWFLAKKSYYIPVNWFNAIKLFIVLIFIFVITPVIVTEHKYLSITVKAIICMTLVFYTYTKNVKVIKLL